MNIRHLANTFGLFSLLALLAACGGGGSGGASPSLPPTTTALIGSFETGDLATEGWSVLDTTVQPNLTINEVDADTPGIDTLEFVELYDGGVGNTDLTGKVLVFYNGSSDTSYFALDLDGFVTDANGFFVAGNAAVPGVGTVFSNNGLQNGADAVALYTDDATTFPGGTAVTSTNLIDAIVYDTNDADDAGLLAVLAGGQPQINEDGNGLGGTQSNQRYNDGAGGPGGITSVFAQKAPTPAAANNPFGTLQVTGAGSTPPGFGFFTSLPTDGTMAVVHGFDGENTGEIQLFRDTILDWRAELSFDYRAGWDFSLGATATLARTISVRVEPTGGGASLLTTAVFTADPAVQMTNLDSGPQTASVDLSAFANTSVRILIVASIPESSTGPGFVQIDNVALNP